MTFESHLMFGNLIWFDLIVVINEPETPQETRFYDKQKNINQTVRLGKPTRQDHSWLLAERFGKKRSKVGNRAKREDKTKQRNGAEVTRYWCNASCQNFQLDQNHSTVLFIIYVMHAYGDSLIFILSFVKNVAIPIILSCFVKYICSWCFNILFLE